MTISVVLLTFNRLAYAKRTLEAALKNLCSRDEIRWHIATDGDSVEYVLDLHNQLLAAGVKSYVTNSVRGGYGRNYNLAMQVAHQMSDYVLPLEDDWELTRPLDVDAIVEDMRRVDVGCARLGYIGYTQQLAGYFAHGLNCGHWLIFDPSSPEHHVFAGHPRIESVEWARSVGPWPEGELPGETEFQVAKRGAARRHVGWPIDLIRPSGDLFVHIGTERSY